MNTGMNRPLKVLHVPEAVGGHPAALAAIERRHGLESWCVAFGNSFTNYPVDERINTSGFRRILIPFHRLRLLWRAFNDYDVIHFNFGTTLVPARKNLASRGPGRIRGGVGRVYNAAARLIEFRDLEWLKRAGKIIAVTMQGDDARVWGWGRENFDYTPAKEIGPEVRAENDDIVRDRLAAFGRWADLIYSLNPDLLHLLPARARFFPYAHPNVKEWNYCGVETEADRPLQIVHAPTSRLFKGTKYIMDALEQLKREGLRFDLRLIEGLSNSEARKAYSQADVLVDQLLTGWYGGVSAELMALGKVVVCYLRDGDFRFLPPEMAAGIPIISANPDTIVEVLRRVIKMPRTSLAELGLASRRWVERWHDPNLIGEQIKADYLAAWRSQSR